MWVREDGSMTRVGLLFPGEMGALVGSAVTGEVLWASEGRSEATRERSSSTTRSARGPEARVSSAASRSW